MPPSKKNTANKSLENLKKQGLEHKIEFMLGQLVYMKTDIDQEPVMVIGITLKPNNSVVYEISSGMKSSDAYGIELSAEKDVLLSIS